MKQGKNLEGVRVVVTRPRSQSGELVRALRNLGARVIAAPAIQIAPPNSWAALDRALKNLDRNDAVIFTSANAVDHFFSRARKVLRRSPSRPHRVFAIGPRTAEALEARGWNGVGVPAQFEGEALARRIHPARGWRILLPQASRAREALPRALRRRGAIVTIVETYRTIAHRSGLARIRQNLQQGRADYMTFTSSSTVEHVIQTVGKHRARRFFETTIPASIGPVTSATLRRLGIRNILEAKSFTSAGIVDAIAAHHARH